MIAIPIFIGLAVWYVLFSFECAMNGATLHPGSQWLMAFRELWHDICHGDPGGLLHTLIMHVVIPFGPTAYWLHTH